MSTQTSPNPISRPIANFHPCRWGDHFLNVSHHDKAILAQVEKEVEHLKEEVKEELQATGKNPHEQLVFIDNLERLGVAYHFDKEIDEALQVHHNSLDPCDQDDDIYHVSLRFRILRQHGFPVSCDVFNKFKNEEGSFKKSLLDDVQGILSLYEASQVRVHGDDVLEEALTFTTTHLISIVDELRSPMAEEVDHALDQHLHRGVIRLESRHYISFYEQDQSHNKTLLKFAKLDFNLLQALHKKELQDLTRWWKGLHVKLPFARDRSAEAYFWILGTYYEPQYSFARKIFNKLFKIVSLVDDTYDAYGTIDELELLTQAVQSWDESCMNQLPDHVKWCYQAILETFKEVEEELAQEGSSNCVQYAKEQMKSLCQAYLQEAKWCHEKHVPTHDEYMEIGQLTSGFPFGIVASFLGMGDIASKEVFEWVCQNPMPKAVIASAIINRLMNDMGGHKFEQSRNHVASSIQCHVERHGAPSEEHAHDALKNILDNSWKDLNEAMLRPYPIPKPLLARILNLARVSDVVYKGEDGYTIVSQSMKDKVAAVLVNPIPI